MSKTAKKPKPASQPTITLRFASERDKAAFLGGLSDGFGENYVDLEWPADQRLASAQVIDVSIHDVDALADLSPHYQIARLALDLSRAKDAERKVRFALMRERIAKTITRKSDTRTTKT